MASIWSNDQLLGELVTLDHDSTVAVYFVKSDAITADIVGRYLPTARNAKACKEKPIRETANCEQAKACLPKIEFLKINPTKYRIKIIHACQNFSLVFSERFDPEWKAYLIKTSAWDVSGGANEKQIFSEHQIWETWLSGRLEFDNLAKGRDGFPSGAGKWSYFVGFNGNSVKWPDSLHREVNAFANGWLFDLRGVQGLPRTQNSQHGYYVQNPDGSITFEVAVEYSPQRILYVVYTISSLSILLCVATVLLKLKK